ncbi:hypothetical protein BKA93DRAFT_767097 [Sparassis latifolia]
MPRGAWCQKQCERHESATPNLVPRVPHSPCASALRRDDSQLPHASGSAVVSNALSNNLVCASGATLSHGILRDGYKTRLRSSPPPSVFTYTSLRCYPAPMNSFYDYASDSCSSRQYVHRAYEYWDDKFSVEFPSAVPFDGTAEIMYNISPDAFTSLPHIKIPHGHNHGVLCQETLSPVDRCATSSSLSSTSYCDSFPPYAQDMTPDSAPLLCTPFGDREETLIPPFDQNFDGPSIHPVYDSNQGDGLSVGCGHVLVKTSPCSSLRGALGDPDGQAFDSHRHRPDFAWATSVRSAAAGHATVPSWDYPSKRPQPPQSDNLSQAVTSSMASYPSVILPTPDLVQNPTAPCSPSLCSERPLLPPSQIPAEPELIIHQPRPIRYIPVKNFVLDATAAQHEPEHWPDTTTAHCQVVPFPEQLRFQSVHPDLGDDDMDVDDTDEDDEESEYIDDDRPPLAEEIEVGPSIGLGSGSRPLDPSSLLLQPISEAAEHSATSRCPFRRSLFLTLRPLHLHCAIGLLFSGCSHILASKIFVRFRFWWNVLSRHRYVYLAFQYHRSFGLMQRRPSAVTFTSI